MPTLDDNFNTIDEQSVSFTPTAMRYGLIGGGIMILLTLLSYLVFLPAGGSMLMLSGFLPFIACAVIIVLVIRDHRDNELGGYITLGRCIGAGVLAVLIAVLISSIFNYVYTTIIDPTIIDQTLEASRGLYETMGLDEDQIDEAIEQAKENQFNPLVSMAIGLFFWVIYGLIASTIIGLIMRKNPPQMA